ncbi:unnamed protein product, partial [Ixodes persulcatus]
MEHLQHPAWPIIRAREAAVTSSARSSILGHGANVSGRRGNERPRDEQPSAQHVCTASHAARDVQSG